MNGPGHFNEAERLLAEAQTQTTHLYGEQDAVPTLLAALAHATLANAAAVALGDLPLEAEPWRDTAGSRLTGP
jgi:hypothetical protein